MELISHVHDFEARWRCECDGEHPTIHGCAKGRFVYVCACGESGYVVVP